MTAHQRAIARSILYVLADLEGGVMSESLLHGSVCLRTTPPPTLGDFDTVLSHLDRLKWITGTEGKLGVRKWAITDAGALARRDLTE